MLTSVYIPAVQMSAVSTLKYLFLLQLIWLNNEGYKPKAAERKTLQYIKKCLKTRKKRENNKLLKMFNVNLSWKHGKLVNIKHICRLNNMRREWREKWNGEEKKAECRKCDLTAMRLQLQLSSVLILNSRCVSLCIFQEDYSRFSTSFTYQPFKSPLPPPGRGE